MSNQDEGKMGEMRKASHTLKNQANKTSVLFLIDEQL